MAFVDTRGRVRVKALPSPPPTYDATPFIANSPTDDAVVQQATDLVLRAIRIDTQHGSSLEEEGVREEWRTDWGQRLASGTARKHVMDLLDERDPDELRDLLLASFYTSMRWAMEMADEAFANTMGMTLARMITSEPPHGELQITFGRSDDDDRRDMATGEER